MAYPEYQYLKLMADILKDGKSKPSRGIHDLKAIFGYQLHFDLRHGFPLLTTKKMPFTLLLHELLWFISGETNIQYLHDHNIRYWDGFADEDLNLGPVYGAQWRHWKGQDGQEFDQLQWAIDEIKNNPDSKAIIVSAWNVADLKAMRLPPCHTMFQFDVTQGKLRLQLYQRSSDVFLGLPFNIAQYAMLLYMVAHLTGLEARELVVSIGSAHLYKNHLDVAKEQLRRKPFPFPKLKISGDIKSIDDFREEHFTLESYEAHPRIKTDLVIL
ncbi:MAG TPA: thymidylate synthase [Candidatus Saccharimonadales bacterium]|nr:thymidylate synthase [Candidatus Saccharimonadales bacterium]